MQKDLHQKITQAVSSKTENGNLILKECTIPNIMVPAYLDKEPTEQELVEAVSEIAKSTMAMYSCLHEVIASYLLIIVIRIHEKVFRDELSESKIEEEIQTIHEIDLEYIRMKSDDLSVTLQLESEKIVKTRLDLCQKAFRISTLITVYLSDVQRYLLKSQNTFYQQNDATSVLNKIMNNV